ncbi:MAG: ABC transporter ATP-binding protein [Clostridiales bacterium]|nr:ABC transporter ATP-binding protein [Clostridiales bacterium]
MQTTIKTKEHNFLSQRKDVKNLNTKESILQARDLCKTFSNESIQQHVLKNLNLDIRKGDFTVIMGDSGAGKSTLLYALSGMDRPSLGTISYGTENITKYSNDKLAVFRRNHCGFVFQQNYLNDTMSVLDNIMVSGLLKSKNRKQLAARAKELLAQVGLDEKSYNKFPNQLSGGEQQRVALVRSIINQPEVLFADEPTGALNSQNTTAVLDVLTEMNHNGQSIVMVTHTIAAAERGNRILYLRDGIITDEIELGEYNGNDQKRHQALREFLQNMGW